MNLNTFQIAFLSLLFSILAIWMTLFLGKSEQSLSVRFKNTLSPICFCISSHQYVYIDDLGRFKLDDRYYELDALITAIKDKQLKVSVDGVVIEASKHSKHERAVSLTNRLTKELPRVGVIWSGI